MMACRDLRVIWPCNLSYGQLGLTTVTRGTIEASQLGIMETQGGSEIALRRSCYETKELWRLLCLCIPGWGEMIGRSGVEEKRP